MANTKHKPSNGKPISSHPLFPAVVALWFGALFGLGSLAIRPSLIESAVLASGVDLFIPAAAPPLGVKARILIALVLAALGAAIGVALALRLARPKAVVRERKRNAARPGIGAAAEAASWNKGNGFGSGPARRPISVHEELGDVFDSPAQLPGRRGLLAVEQEEQLFQPHELAPLPGGEPQIFDVGAARLAPVNAVPAPAEDLAIVEEIAPLDLGAFPAPAPAPVEMPAVIAQSQPQPQPKPALDWSVAPVAEPEPALIIQPPSPLLAEAQAEALATPLAPLAAPAGLAMSDLTTRLQESMARRRAAKGEAAAAATFPAAEPVPAPIAADPAAEDALSQPGEPDFMPPPRIAIFAEQAAEIPPVISPIVATPLVLPAALRPVAFETAEDEDHADLGDLMPRRLVMPQTNEASAEAAAIITEPPEDAFASLLRIETPHPEFVRIEERGEPLTAVEPVVIFPGQMATAQPVALRRFDAPNAGFAGGAGAAAVAIPAIDPAEAELALRSALANLQRISGAA